MIVIVFFNWMGILCHKYVLESAVVNEEKISTGAGQSKGCNLPEISRNNGSETLGGPGRSISTCVVAPYHLLKSPDLMPGNFYLF